ncbi:DUF2066 domain-containing protein [Candidatus Berkiella cookevillensis]|uniref:DUF2066 domain-containing protein n=1 Tax=Candidatus Berkiella cookevillensis TaxID=437022 RepID=A0A0Q9Y9G7_9GAMM|nr:DUF2066 domain-containing protein [Candidatus Berkiella cookevillensis]MCS5708788.1 DUF2066 domain-containing protein [Candidatus Berkiella cookevillensis]
MLQQLTKIRQYFSITQILFSFFSMLICTNICANVPANTEISQNLYQAVIVAPSRDEAQRIALFQEGMRIIFKRIAGTEDVLKLPAVEQALKNASAYVERYDYHGDQLRVIFSAQMMNDLLFKNGYALWGQKRPTLILWLAMDENNKRYIMGEQSNPDLHAMLLDFAQERGLPLVLPVMDLTDMQNVSVSDIFSNFPSVLTGASSRYGANAILVGKMIKKPQGWEAQWQILIDSYHREWVMQSADFNDLLQKGLTSVISDLQGRYGIKQQDTAFSKSLLIGVKGIQSSRDFSRAESYLNGLEQVKGVTVRQVFANGVIFEVKPQNGVDKEILSQVISMEKRFAALGYHERPVESLDLTYQWTP